MAVGMMITDAGEWLVIPGSVVDEPGSIYLQESMGCDISEIVRSLRDDCYEKPFVVDDGECRRLHFGLDYVQSEMLLRDPYDLRFAYAREMMCFLLFVPDPRQVTLVGLGGGSMTRFCDRQLPDAKITTIEIDDDVIAMRGLFETPMDGQRVQLVHGDAVAYFAGEPEACDAVLVDGCDRYGVAAAFRDPLFYRNVYRALRPRGMLVMNLIGPAPMVNDHLEMMADTFGEPLIVRSLRHDRNKVVFAQKGGFGTPDWPALQRRAVALQKVHGIDFPAFVRGLRRGRRLEAEDHRR